MYKVQARHSSSVLETQSTLGSWHRGHTTSGNHWAKTCWWAAEFKVLRGKGLEALNWKRVVAEMNEDVERRSPVLEVYKVWGLG